MPLSRSIRSVPRICLSLYLVSMLDSMHRKEGHFHDSTCCQSVTRTFETIQFPAGHVLTWLLAWLLCCFRTWSRDHLQCGELYKIYSYLLKYFIKHRIHEPQTSNSVTLPIHTYLLLSSYSHPQLPRFNAETHSLSGTRILQISSRYQQVGGVV